MIENEDNWWELDDPFAKVVEVIDETSQRIRAIVENSFNNFNRNCFNTREIRRRNRDVLTERIKVISNDENIKNFRVVCDESNNPDELINLQRCCINVIWEKNCRTHILTVMLFPNYPADCDVRMEFNLY